MTSYYHHHHDQNMEQKTLKSYHHHHHLQNVEQKNIEILSPPPSSSECGAKNIEILSSLRPIFFIRAALGLHTRCKTFGLITERRALSLNGVRCSILGETINSRRQCVRPPLPRFEPPPPPAPPCLSPLSTTQKWSPLSITSSCVIINSCHDPPSPPPKAYQMVEKSITRLHLNTFSNLRDLFHMLFWLRRQSNFHNSCFHHPSIIINSPKPADKGQGHVITLFFTNFHPFLIGRGCYPIREICNG